jgi:epoxyqueuosine reductase QueG
VEITEDALEASMSEAGIEGYGLLGRGRLLAACEGMPPSLLERLGAGRAGGAIPVALPYGEGPAAPPAWAAGTAVPGPLARLARFARADWYAELAARMRAAASALRSRVAAGGVDPGPSRDWRYFVNSRMPERRLALEAGLGRLGRNGLVLLPKRGSAAVLGLLLLPEAARPAAEAPALDRDRLLDPACASCGACREACPTGALKPAGPGAEGGPAGFSRELCLQHWSAVPGPLPEAIEAAWGDRLYGCDACQEACPLFKPDASARTLRGLLGPGLPAAWLASAPEGEIRAALRGSVLGMGWISIDALRRNAFLVLRADKSDRGI